MLVFILGGDWWFREKSELSGAVCAVRGGCCSKGATGKNSCSGKGTASMAKGYGQRAQCLLGILLIPPGSLPALHIQTKEMRCEHNISTVFISHAFQLRRRRPLCLLRNSSSLHSLKSSAPCNTPACHVWVRNSTTLHFQVFVCKCKHL